MSHNFFTSLSFLNFFEAASTSIMMPLLPFMLAPPRYNKLQIIVQEESTILKRQADDTYDKQFQEQTADISIQIAFALFTFYLGQTIGTCFWSYVITTSKRLNNSVTIMLAIQTFFILTYILPLGGSGLIWIRFMHGFFANGVAMTKLTMPNFFYPARHMGGIFTSVSMWYFGLFSGVAIGGIFAYPQDKFTSSLNDIDVFRIYPLIVPLVSMSAIGCTTTVAFALIFPSPDSMLYKQCTWTIFNQHHMQLSQHEFTFRVSDHQHNRSTLSMLHQMTSDDRNIVFAFLHLFISYFILYGIVDLLPLYCFTVLLANNEIFISMIMISVFMTMAITQQFFTEEYAHRRRRLSKSKQEVQLSWVLVILSLTGLYFVRLFRDLDEISTLILSSSVIILFIISINSQLQNSHYILWVISKQSNLHPHVNNFNQMIGATARLFAGSSLGILAWINFSLNVDLMSSFLFVFLALVLLSILGMLAVSCMNKNFYEEEENEMKQTLINQVPGKQVYC